MRPACQEGGTDMPLQNRVDPFGDIHAIAARGLFTGNRGIIHDPDTKTLLKKRWALKAWIICRCELNGRRREPMGRNGPGGKAGWTELFFLDEVTALAAGHRPCFFCQRHRAKDFLSCFGDAFDIADPKAPEIDARLHEERLASGGQPKPLDRAALDDLPDGVLVGLGTAAFAIRKAAARPWSVTGFGKPIGLDEIAKSKLFLITPQTTVAVLRAGYKPIWHGDGNQAA